jgi:hydroxymethylpyrimidine pyrophosphatase-like HAD family hydrolase
VGPERVLAAGDHLNDLPMLQQQHARYLVTNANAMPEVVALVRRQQGFVSLRSHGHGVVEGLEHFLAGK